MRSKTGRRRGRSPLMETDLNMDTDEGSIEGEMSGLFENSCSNDSVQFTVYGKVSRIKNEDVGRLDQILQPKNFPDLVLYCGKSLRKYEAHRAVFAVCSDFFKLMLEGEEPFKHSYVFLPDYEYEDVMNLVNFIYSGEIELSNVQGEKLEQMLDELGFREESVLYYISKSTKVLTADGFVSDPETVAALDSEPEKQRSRPMALRKRMPKGAIKGGGKTGDSVEEGTEQKRRPGRSKKRKSVRAKALAKKKAKVDRESANTSAGSDDDIGHDEGRLSDGASSSRDDDTQDTYKSSVKTSRTAKCPECDELLSFTRMPVHLRNEHEIEKAYFCDACDNVFYDSAVRIEHEKIHPELLTECAPCGKQMTKRQMKQHKQLHSRKEKTFHCTVCALKVPVYKRWQHSLVHTPNNALCCEQCGKKYFSVGSLNRHMLCHSGEEHHICHHCKRVFPTLEEKLQHGKTHTRTKMGSKCQTCGEMLNHTHFIPHLKKHGYQEMEWAGNDTTCPRCNRTFESVDLTVNHLVGHLDSPRPHECNICFLPMRTMGLLESHKQRVHMSNVAVTLEQEELSPVVSCPLCKNTYDWRSGVLRRHIMDHAWDILECDETERDVSCVDCGRVFPYARYAVNHFVGHIESSRRPEFECRKCYLMEKNQSTYKHHIRRCKGDRGRVDSRKRKNDQLELEEEEEEDNFVKRLPILTSGPESYETQWLTEQESESYFCSGCKASFDTEEDCSIHQQFCQ